MLVLAVMSFDMLRVGFFWIITPPIAFQKTDYIFGSNLDLMLFL